MKKLFKKQYEEVILQSEELPEWYRGDNYRILRDTYALDHILPNYSSVGGIDAEEISEAAELRTAIKCLGQKNLDSNLRRAALKVYVEITEKYETTDGDTGLIFEIHLQKWAFSEEKEEGAYTCFFDEEWLEAVEAVQETLFNSGEFAFDFRRRTKKEAKERLLKNCKDKRDFFNKRDYLSFAL